MFYILVGWGFSLLGFDLFGLSETSKQSCFAMLSRGLTLCWCCLYFNSYPPHPKAVVTSLVSRQLLLCPGKARRARVGNISLSQNTHMGYGLEVSDPALGHCTEQCCMEDSLSTNNWWNYFKSEVCSCSWFSQEQSSNGLIFTPALSPENHGLEKLPSSKHAAGAQVPQPVKTPHP